ncbi:MAG: flavin reductase family protein [Lysinibacillus sp.]|nr:flavin reductase family protein [Lysinibacillus sp.]
MLSINPKDQTERENYKLLTGTVIPRPIAFITTKSTEGTLNGAPFSYFNIVSSNPPMLSVSIQRKDGKMKDTAKNIYDTQEFVVHITDHDNVEPFNAAAANLPSNVSEIELTKLTPVESELVSVPGVKEAKVRFECKLVQAIPLGSNNEGEPSCDLFVGEVVLVHLDEKIYDNTYIKARELHAVSRLAGNHFATIGNIFSLQRPE